MKRLILAIIAALALSAPAFASNGWYLMQPPYFKGRNGYISFPNGNAPLSEWQQIDTFATIDECKAAHDQQAPKYPLLFIEHPDDPLPEMPGYYKQLQFATITDAIMGQCIATDDPRLAR